MLCRKYYTVIGKNGKYTRINGLPRDKYKALLLHHIENCSKCCHGYDYWIKSAK
jgi:hypothetical protein